jgi:release factor glutamine methyltransferase
LLSEILEAEVPRLLKEDKNIKFLEIGSGSGIQLTTLKNLGVKNIDCVDINPESVKHCKKLGFNCKISNLFKTFERKVKRRKPWCPRKFEVIIFNPPYLPFDSREPKSSGIATTGGKKGSEIINRFLKQTKNHLAKNGRIFLVTSSLTKGIDFSGYNKKILDSKKLFFEELFVLELTIRL